MRIEQTPDQAKADFLHNLDDKFLECRGDHHDWPVLKLGTDLPRGVSAIRQRDGCYQLKMRCKNCGKVRSKLTLPKGVWDLDVGWAYPEVPKGFASPPGSGVTRMDCVAELGRRLQEQIVKGASK